MLYSVFAEAFDYPDAAAIGSGILAERLDELLNTIDPQLCRNVDWGALRDTGKESDALVVEYTRLFDVGVSGPVCSLFGGLHYGPQMKTMEEVVRYYNHFGLTLSEKMQETPDHLTIELEFLHFLSYGENDLSQRGEDVKSYQCAQRDFIARHPGRWVPIMCEKLERAKPMPFFRQLCQLLDAFLQSELTRLETLHGRASTVPVGHIPHVGD
ncbi:MAG: hypothetical protein HOC23_04740 [Halieaceae bacterium]|nr:hypothetical protein [Halieaceae bacterium]